MYNAKDTIRHTITQMSEIFQLEKVPLGTYTVKYERDSMGTVYTYGAAIKLVNQTNFLPFKELGFKSFGSISYFKIDTSEAYRFQWNYRVVRDPKPTSIYESTIRYFAAKNRNVSSNNYDTTWTIGYGNSLDTLETSFDYAFFQRHGFVAGDKVYVKAHSDGYHSNSYMEPGKKNTVYPNINPVSPPIDSFVLRY
jgi:hypothetical protein